MARLGTVLLGVALVLGLLGVALLVSHSFAPNPFYDRHLELFNLIGGVLLVGGLASIPLTVLGVVLAKAGGARLGALGWSAIVLALLGAAYPALILFAYSGCPGGIC